MLSANALFYKVSTSARCWSFPTTRRTGRRYEEQVIRTFYLSHADAPEMVQLLNMIMRVPGVADRAGVRANKNAELRDRPRHGAACRDRGAPDRVQRPAARRVILLDVQILEVNRTRAKQFGLDLSNYSITGIFSPEVSADDQLGRRRFRDERAALQPEHDLARASAPPISISTVPTAVVRFLETDSQTKLMAKPQLRGQEGQKITLNLGDDFPVPSARRSARWAAPAASRRSRSRRSTTGQSASSST